MVDLGREVLLLKEHVHRLPQLGLPGVVDVLEDRSDLVSVPDIAYFMAKLLLSPLRNLQSSLSFVTLILQLFFPF